MGGRDNRMPEQRYEDQRMVSYEGYQLQYVLQTASCSTKKSYTEDFLTWKCRQNTGELEIIFIENNHEPIVSREIFEKVMVKKKEKS